VVVVELVLDVLAVDEVVEVEVDVEVVEEVVGQSSVPLKIVKLSKFPSVAGLPSPCRLASSMETGLPVPALHV